MASINCARDSVGIRPLQIGSLYPALERMESQGLIVSSEPAFPETGNNRRYYRLTDLGKQSLDAARAYRAILSGPADA